MAPIGAARANLSRVPSFIPDSAVRQWPFRERNNSIIVENLANDDGTVSGSPTNTADSSFYDGYYEATDGTDDAVLLPVSEWESQIQSEDFGFAFTVRGSSAFLDNGGVILGAAANSFSDNLLIDGGGFSSTTAGNGQPTLLLEGGGNGDSAIELSTAIDDNTIYRLFFIVPSSNPNDWRAWVNGSEDSIATVVNNNTDLSTIDLTSGVSNIALGARNNSGTIEEETVCDLDHPILYDSPSTDDVAQDYDVQPFS